MFNKACSCSAFFLLICFLLIVSEYCFIVEADPNTCKPSGKIKGKKPPSQCNKEHDSDCCKEGQLYNVYKCSPPVLTNHTKAILTLNGFDNGEDGGGPSKCDNKYHKDKELVVALSTGWFNNRKMCLHYIHSFGNGKSVKAKVVDECDSTMGCDSVHSYQPPCDNNIVDASDAVWDALGVPSDSDQRGWMDVYWSDA